MEDVRFTGEGLPPREAGTLVTFYRHAVDDLEATEKEGRAMFKYHDYVKIQAAGQRHSVFDGRVTSKHKDRFPHIWKGYVERAEQTETEGTPLSNWAYLSKARVLSFHALGVMSVEALAAVSDSNCKNLGPDGMSLKQKAQQFLDSETQTSVDLKNALEQIKALTDRIDDMEAVKVIPSKKRGRPPKKVTDDAANNSTGCTE